MIFPKVEYLDAEPNDEFGVWEDDKKGGQYDNGLIIIYAPYKVWNNESMWLAKTTFHEFLHHVFDSMRCKFLHKLIHHPAIRRII